MPARFSPSLAVATLAIAACLLGPARAEAVAVAVGTNGISVSSSTAGASWNAPSIIDANVSFAGIWMTSDVNGVAVGNGNAIFRTANGGGTWSPVASPITTTYNDVMFPTASIGYIAATNGQVLKSTNGGTSWVAQSPGVPGSMLAVHFVSATQGVTVGTNGAIARTTNGGTSWLNETTGTAALNDVFLFDASNGWAVGAGGTILRTTNGGDTWSTVTSGTTVDLTAVWFTSASLGFVCGGDRVLRRTTNGGTSWSAVTLPTTQVQSGLFDLMFADPDTGVVVGSGVSAYRTIDGGTTWTVANPDPTANEVLQAVHIGRPPGPPPQVTVNVNALPAGRSFRVDGQTFTTAQVFTWDSGSSHQLEGVTPQSINAGERYVFSAWSGGSNSTGTSINVSPTTETSFTANYQRQFQLTMPGVSGGTVQPGTTWQNAGASVQISANDATGYDFVAWAGTGSGSYTGPNDPATITMNGAITETADFDPVAITLTFQTSPSGKQVIVDGTTRTTPYALQTTADLSHTLGVPSPQGEANGTRFAYLSWSDGGAQSHTIDPLVSGTYTASLKTQYFLTTLADPAHSGSLSPADGWYDAGDKPTLTPVPGLGWSYFLMQGTGSGSVSGVSSDPIKPVMNGPITQTAYFSDLTMRTVTVRAIPPGPDLSLGTLDLGSSKTFLWPSGQPLPLSAPATQTAVATVKQWQWKSWSDGGARTHNATPTANTTYTANFDVQFQLELEAETGGTTNPPVGVSWIDSNTVVQFAGLPDASHRFDQWTGFGTSSYSGLNNPAQVTMRGKVKEVASFVLVPRLTLDPALTGRRFIAGEPETIRWDATFASTTPCQVEFRRNTSPTWTPIGSATAQTKQLVWTPPDTPLTNLQMRILWPVNVAAGDTTAGYFVICDPYFNVGPAITPLASNSAPLDVLPLDFDDDGILDLAIATAQGLTVRSGLAASTFNGSGGFGPPTAIAVTGGLGRLASIDFDSDGDPDLVATGRAGASVSFYTFYRGTAGGQGPYTGPGGLSSANGQFTDIAVADFDEDGISDVIGLVGATSMLCAYRGDGSDGVANRQFRFLGLWPTQPAARRIRVADFDRDGRLDVLVLSGAPYRLTVHFGSAGPGWAAGPPVSLALPEDPADFALGDFDEDKLLDVVWSAPNDGRIFIVPRVGAGGPGGTNFGVLDTVATDRLYTRLSVADFDHDGHADVVAVDAIGDVTTIHRGKGDGTFEFLTQRTAGANASHATVHDFLEDYRTDLLLTDADGATVLHTGDLASCGSSGGQVTLDEPNVAGLAFVVGQEMTIRWQPNSVGVVAADLDISRDDGATWQPIARGIVQRTYSWTVTPPVTEKGRIRVRSSTGFYKDYRSLNAFTIIPPSVDVPALVPTVAAFAAPWPNPGRGTVHFRLALPTEASPRVTLHDVAGRRIRLLHAGALPAGEHALAWDGRDDAGREVAAGVYFARATWAGFEAKRRVVRLE